MISIIVAVAQNLTIGIDNRLLLHIPEDLKRFKKITSGSKIIMGRNTYLSLPVRPLPNRTSIVITDRPGEIFENCIMVHSLEEAVRHCSDAEECFVIGGASVYRQFLGIAGKIYYTKVYANFEGDTFFPALSPDEWQLVSDEPQKDHESFLKYSFQLYVRKSSNEQ